MFDKSIRLFCFLCIILSPVKIKSNPVPANGQAIYLTVGPNQIGSHTVGCTLDTSLIFMDKVTSLMLYGTKAYGRAGEFKSLAIVDLWNPQASFLNDLSDTEADVFGGIGIGDNKISKLQISWKSPLNVWPTQYKCVANGLDRNGLVVSISMTANTATLKERVTNLGDEDNQSLIGEPYVNSSSTEVENMGTSLLNLSSTVDAIQQTVYSLEDLVEDQTAKIKRGQETMISLLKNINLAHFTGTFDMSGVFKGKRYVVSKAEATFNIQAADVQCELMGGHLVEIEDKEEYDFVFGFCKDLGGNNFFTGGNDIKEEGVWTFWHSRKDVVFANWSQGQPNDHQKKEDCMEIRISFGGSNDLHCDAEAKFVCEVPA